MRARLFAFAALGIAFVPRLAAAADYWVAPGGADSAAGTTAAPWATLQYAASKVAAGDTVHVKDGSYVGFDLRTSGTATAPIKFVGEGTDVEITARNSKTPDGINIETADYVVIENFVINGMPRAGARCALGKFDTFRKIRADKNNTWGILTGCCTDTIIEDNVLTNSVVQHGLYFSNSGDRPKIRRNVIYGNYGNGIHMNGDVSIDCSPTLVTDGLISGAIVEENIIYDNGAGGGSGINCAAVVDSIIRNNLLYSSKGSGISLYQGEGSTGATNNLVVNNTVIQAATGRWALNINQASTGTIVRNNIFFTLHPTRGSIVITADSLKGFDSNYNLLTPRMSADGDPTIVDLAGWQALGYDKNSAAATPDAVFVSPSTNDYHLKAGSPAIDKGEAAKAPPTDITGAARPFGAGVDIGAYEFGSTSPPDGGPPIDSGTSDTGASDSSTPSDSGSSGDGGPNPSDGASEDTGGCGCSVPAEKPAFASLLVIPLLSAASMLRRRRTTSGSRPARAQVRK